MFKNDKLEQYLYNHISFSLVGRLTSGIVHNLNGPLQILSMQIELFNREVKKEISDLQSIERELTNDSQKSIIANLIDKLQKRVQRIEQVELTINRMEDIVNIIAKRCRTHEASNNTVLVNQLIEEELLFWQADLFFKHNVKKHIKLSEEPIVIQTDETNLRTVIDLMLAAAITSIKDLDTPSITIETSIKEDCIIIELYQSGKSFNEYITNNRILDIFMNADDVISLEQSVIINLLNYSSKAIDSDIIISDHSLILKLYK